MANDTTATPAKREHPVAVRFRQLDQREGDLVALLQGTGVRPQAFLRAAKTSIRLNLDLAATSFDSFWNACLRACRDGLLPDGVEGAIVPYKTQAQWIPMYQGMLRQFRRSGQFKSILADIVREGEEFDYCVTEEGPRLRHVPGDGSGKVIKAYAAATTVDGGKMIVVMPITEIEKIKGMSRTQRDDSPWKKWPEEMMKKTALRRLSKVLPSARDAMADDDDDEIEELRQITVEQEPQRPRLAGHAALDEFANASDGLETPDQSNESGNSPTGQDGGGGNPTTVAPADSSAATDDKPKTPEAYFDLAEAMLNRMREQGASLDGLKKWFTSDEQRKQRVELAIPVDTSNEFAKRVLT